MAKFVKPLTETRIKLLKPKQTPYSDGNNLYLHIYNANKKTFLFWYTDPISKKRLKRVFNIDIETCSGCGGAMKVIACIEDPIVIKQILDHLKHKAETSGTRALPESRAPPAELLLGLFD